ncbi:MAG TPA: ThiF family adenylyltransferase [Chthonomonadaceae bacterium]|nr:ThiF family adenylyltransferase [Chthonomonadaceae bacterium]
MPEDRYARHYLLEGWDQDRLAAARVMVAGAGAIGNEAIKLLALMGIGHLLIVDFDRIEISNLSRTVLFRESDLGRSKAEVSAARAQNINPEIAVRFVDGDLEYDVGLGVYRAMDVVLGCLDSIQARLALNRACRRAGVPWINAGIEATFAEVALFSGAVGACYECGMSAAMWEQRNRRFSCGGLKSDAAERTFPTTATVASLAAGLMVHEALLLLHGRKKGRGGRREQGTGNREQSRREEGAEGKREGAQRAEEGLMFGQMLSLLLKPYSLQTLDLPVNAQCLAHERSAPVEVLEAGPQQLTALDLLERAGCPDGCVEMGFDLLSEMCCLECGRAEPILRPVEKCSLTLTCCPDCKSESRRPETLSWLDAGSDLARRPLAELGLPEYAVLAVHGGDGRRYFQLSGEYSF